MSRQQSRQQPLPRVSPESVGIPSGVIDALVNNFENSGFEPHSFMVLRYGKVCAEGWWRPYRPDALHNVHSYTKTFLATALGIVVGEGKVSLEDKLISFFPDKAPANPCDNLKAMEIRHLLSMNTGQHNEPQIRAEKDFVGAFLAAPVEHAPGTWFRYNSCASHMLGNVIYKVTGKTFMEVLADRIFGPMGFGHVECTDMADGLPGGGGGMALCTEDMARLAQLYLNRGAWDGRQLVPAEWIDAATVPHFDNSNGLHADGNEDWEAGYGYQLWMNRPPRSYRFDGAFGQEAMIYPQQQLAVVFTSATTKMADMLRMVSRFALDALCDGPLPENRGERAQLLRRLASLKQPELTPIGISGLQDSVCGKRITLGENQFMPVAPFRLGVQPDLGKAGVKWIEPSFSKDALTLKFETKDGLYAVNAGMAGEAVANALSVDGADEEFHCSARWTDQNVLSVVLRRLRVVQTAVFTIAYHLNGVNVALELHPRGEINEASGRMA